MSSKRNIEQELDDVVRAICHDCQPKSKDDAVYVSEKWLHKVLRAGNRKLISPNLNIKNKRMEK